MKKKAPWKGGAERNKSMIEKLREKMREAGMDLYVVPSSDPHNSEYVSDYFQQRRFFCGFTGSAGTLVVTLEEACLFTDGRYYVQAERELAGSGIILMKSGSDGVPPVADYIVSKAHKGFTAGFDGSVTRAEWGNELEQRLKEKEAGIAWETDLGKELWSQRPPFPMAPAYVFPVEYAGESRAFKLERLREKMAEMRADVHVLSSLDDICWLLNVRGSDVLHSPVVLSYVIVDMKKVFFYVHKEKFDAAARDELEADGVEFRAYQDFYQDLEKVTGKILIDSRRANYKICRIVRAKEPVEGENPTLLMKAVKNPVEIAHLKEIHRYDGAAFVRFQYWLEKALASGEEVTEYSAAKKLEGFRREIQGYLDESFETISAYGANGAMMHYCAKPQ